MTTRRRGGGCPSDKNAPVTIPQIEAQSHQEKEPQVLGDVEEVPATSTNALWAPPDILKGGPASQPEITRQRFIVNPLK